MNKKQMRVVQWLVLALAIVSIGIGVARTEPYTVMKKATNICLECIGIG